MNTVRRSCFCCGLSSRQSSRYGNTNAHSSSFTSLGYGLRRREQLGLRWQDIDLETAQSDVRKALHRVKGDGLHLGEPKSSKFKRKRRILQVCLAALARRRGKEATEKQRAEKKWNEGDYVFTGNAGKPLHPDDISRKLPAVLVAAGLPRVRLQDLFHCCATLLQVLGVSAKMVQETLGHSSYQLTMDTYSHVMPALKNEVAETNGFGLCGNSHQISHQPSREA